MPIYSTWLQVALFLLAIICSTNSLSSIPLGTFRYNELQTHIFQIKSPNQPMAAIFQCVAIPFRQAKVTALTVDSVILGVAELDYITREISAGLYQQVFDLTIISLTKTDLTLQLQDSLMSVSTFKTSILIISNEYRHRSYIQTKTLAYTPATNYVQIIPINYYITPRVLYYICGMNVKSTSTKGMFEFYLGYSSDLSVVPPIVSTNIFMWSGGHTSAFVHMKLIIYYPALFALIFQTEILPYNFEYINATYSKYLYVPKQMTNSEVFYGLTQFCHFISTTTQQDRFHFSFSYTAPTQIYMHFDVPAVLYYQVLVINHYSCDFPQHYILIQNLSSNLYECYDQCSAINHYTYFDTVTRFHRCDICPPPCRRCFNSSVCTECLEGYYMTEDSKCFFSYSYYLPNLLAPYALHCSNALFACQTCFVTGGFCTQCVSNAYVFSSGTTSASASTLYGVFNFNGLAVGCKYCDSLWFGCQTCNTTMCFTCKPGLYLQNFNKCAVPPVPPAVIVIKPCTDSIRCETCLQTNLDNCLKCFQSSFSIVNGKCVSPCGDGIVLDNQVCDDGNAISYDGCSSDCMKVEDGWTCQSNALLGYSQCQYTDSITLKTMSISKIVDENKVVILMKNSNPFMREWMSLNTSELKAMVSLKVPEFEKSQNPYTFDYSVKFTKLPSKFSSLSAKLSRLLQTIADSFDYQAYQCIQIEIIYNSNASDSSSMSLSHQQISVTLSPMISNRLVFQTTQPSEAHFELITDDNTIIQYFSPQYYQKLSIVKMLGFVVGISTMVILLLSFLAFFLDGNNSRQILLAIETAGIVQFTYFSLIGIGELNPLFVALAQGLKYSCGFDMFLSGKETTQRILIGMGIQSPSFLDNVNVSLGLVFVFFTLGLVFIIVNKIKFRKKEQNDNQSQIQDPNGQNLDEKQNFEEIQEKSKNQSENQGRFQRWSKIFLINFSFGSFLFFLYKFVAFMTIQIKIGSDSMAGLDQVGMGLVGAFLLGFFLLMFFKFNFFQHLTEKLSSYETFEDKEKRLSEQCETDYISSKTKKQKIYFIFILIERILNCVALIFTFQSFSFHGLIPIILLLSQIIYITFYDRNIYNPPNKYRMYLTYVIGIAIQVLLLIRKVLMDRLSPGTEEGEFGLYLPFSILALMFVLLFVALSFQLYSIKKIRCVQLNYEWERVDPARKKEIQAQQKFILLKLENAIIAASMTKAKNDSTINKFNETLRSDQTNRNLVKNDYSSRNSQSKSHHSKKIKEEEISDKNKNEEDFETEKNKTNNNHETNLPDSSKKLDDQVLKSEREPVQISKVDLKREIKSKLKQSKIPKQRAKLKTNHLGLLEIDKTTDQAHRKDQQTKYKYTDRYRYNLYEVYDQI